MTSAIVEELWKRVIESEKELDILIDNTIDKYIKKKKGDDRNWLRHLLLSISEEIVEQQQEMIKYTNLWREFKRLEDE